MRQLKWILAGVTAFCVQAAVARPQSAAIRVDSTVILDFDSAFVRKYIRSNDARIFYGTQSTGLEFGSKKETDPEIPTALYHNVNDFVGVGITYKILDADLSFSLPNTRLLEEERENLDQFRFSLSYTGRKYALRGIITNAYGVIAADPEDRFKSEADIHQFRLCGQFTYIFHNQKYSYRAAMFQQELQRQTAGSFLLRLEPFYRSLGAKTGLVPSPYDKVEVYGDQTDLQTLNGGGTLVLPGYGITWTPFGDRFYVSSLIFAGPGIAFNFTETARREYSHTNLEWGGMVLVNVGYNGDRSYLNFNVTGDVNYSPLNPSYLTNSNLKISLTFGFRFFHLENVLPASLF